MELYSLPLRHSCGCTIRWATENRKLSIEVLKSHVYTAGKYACPFCSQGTKGYSTKTYNRSLNFPVLVFFRRSEDIRDSVNGVRNRF